MIVLPESLKNKLINRAKQLGISVEEYVGELLLKELSSDPNDRVFFYVSLYKKYISDAEKLIKQEDYVQASEKLWGAVASIVKAVALKKINKRLTGHGELWEFVSSSAREMNDEELSLLWKVAISMHVNFYENWAPPEEVKSALKQIKLFAKNWLIMWD